MPRPLMIFTMTAVVIGQHGFINSFLIKYQLNIVIFYELGLGLEFGVSKYWAEDEFL